MTYEETSNKPPTGAEAVDGELISPDEVEIPQRNIVAYTDGNTFTMYGPVSTTAGGNDIAATLNQAFSDGAVGVVLPVGEYHFNTTITPTTDSAIHGRGETVTGTRLYFEGSGVAVDAMTNDAAVSLRNITLQNQGTFGTTVGLHTSGSTFIENSRIRGFNYGWQPDRSDHYSIGLSSSFSANNYGVYGGANALAILNTAVNQNTTAGLFVDNDHRAMYVGAGSSFEDNGWGIDINAHDAGFTVEHSYIEDNADGGVRVDPSAADGRQPKILNNYFRSNGPVDIQLKECFHPVVDNNTFAVNTTSDVGVQIFNTVTEAEVQPERTILNPTTPIVDSGVRTIIGQKATNSGDPNTTGLWNANEDLALSYGVAILDTVNHDWFLPLDSGATNPWVKIGDGT